LDNVVLTEKSNEEEISRCVKAAIEKLDRVDANAEKEKTLIVKDLAKDLEGKIPTESICNEIVHQLHGKASPRLIRVSLDEKYKEKHRVENARKQKKHKSTEDLAAPLPLTSGDTNRQEEKMVVIDTLGNVVVEPHPSINKRTGFNDSGDEVTQNDSVVTSLNDEITSVNRRKEELTDTKKEVLVSHICMPFEDLRKDMATVFQTTKGIGDVFFRVWVDIGTRLVEIKFCGITQDNTMTSTGKGKLKEAGTNFPLGS
jgi:hypothetical protein